MTKSDGLAVSPQQAANGIKHEVTEGIQRLHHGEKYSQLLNTLEPSAKQAA
ncbi:hypothetical protein SM0020_03490 [Sinorhizobium meliloti CCNWSX0020]|uniref:Uncharacterized protein n=1 Tax=Sinorhizobium meliloti CCNWSX0020 TaxID=1107881 RepID=H0FU69_RHIML|nr:hypothetical protein [Sinorhizobium meliloti]EHK79400.1 hypothetical protein SM0020_03490 [Sinorhizobium meliloti CCNWSX0020]